MHIREVNISTASSNLEMGKMGKRKSFNRWKNCNFNPQVRKGNKGQPVQFLSSSWSHWKISTNKISKAK